MIVTLLAAFLLLVAGYFAWWAVSYVQLWCLLPAAVALVTGIGLFHRKRWSQYLWFAIALSASAFWLISIVRIALSGWPFSDILESIISLLPGLSLLALCAGGSIAVYKHFGSVSVNEP